MRTVTVLMTAGLILSAGVLSAHHSFDAYFVSSETTTIEGVVTEFWFANPHARIYLEVTNEAGEVEEWMAEGGSRNVLLRWGWSQDTIKAGEALDNYRKSLPGWFECGGLAFVDHGER